MFKYVIESSCSSCLVEVHIRGHEHLANIDSSVDLQHHRKRLCTQFVSCKSLKTQHNYVFDL